MSVKMERTIAGITFKNPVFTASGTFGAGWQFDNFMDVSLLGAITTKGCAITPWSGNSAPRSCDIYGGVMNSVGLQNPGVDGFITESSYYLQELSKKGTRIICQIVGHSVNEYVKALTRFVEVAPWASAFEINISCPNIAEGSSVQGSSPEGAAEVMRACRAVTEVPLFVKMAPTRIPEIAKALESEGADALVVINSIPGMAINIENRRSKLSRPVGGISGPCLHPIALRMVWEAVQAVSIPVIGCGGITDAISALEFLIVGAQAVEIGSQNLFDPRSSERILNDVKNWLETHSITSVSDIIGSFEG